MSVQVPDWNALEELIAAREAAMPLTQKMQQRLSHLDWTDLGAVAQASPPSRESRAASLLFVRRYGDGDDADGAVRALLEHYEHCASDRGQPTNRRRALGLAARQVRLALGEHVGEQSDPSPVPASDWKQSVGLGEGRFTLKLSQFLGHSLVGVAEGARPAWLGMGDGQPDRALSGLRLWHPSDSESLGHSEMQEQLDTAWAAWLDANVDLCHDLLEPLRARANHGWGPSDDVESQHLWNWIGLVAAVFAVRQGGPGRRRRMLSAAELSRRLPESDRVHPYPWVDGPELIASVLENLGPTDPQVSERWAAYSARLAGIFPDHTEVVGAVSRHDRAKLRDAWSRRFGPLLQGRTDTTIAAFEAVHEVASTLEAEKQTSLSRLRRSGRTDSKQVLRLVAPFLDDIEAAILDSVERLLAEIDEGLAPRRGSLDVLTSLSSQIDSVVDSVRGSGSLLLLESVMPMIDSSLRRVEKAHLSLLESAPASIHMRMLHRRYPLSWSDSEPFDLLVTVQNSSEVRAIDVRLSPKCPDLEFAHEEHGFLDIDPGEEIAVTLRARVAAPTGATVVSIGTEWVDELDRTYRAVTAFEIETEERTRWTEEAVNPFVLNAVDQPGLLVGREDDLRRMRDIVAASESTIVTGHKRVGKTSLVQVLVNSAVLPAAGRVISLGRSISAEPTASELVRAMLSAIEKAVVKAWPDQAVPDLDDDQYERNFALAGGDWLEDLGETLEENRRVLLVVDDFDELPLELYEGPEAESLFKFLRPMVGEQWLSVFFVGSEVLPTITTENHNYRLNTVSETIVSEFRSSAATRKVLERSAKELEWNEDLVSRLHSVTNGNPYYIMLVGREVWSSMREQQRAEVRASDLDAAVARIAEIRSDAHFVHFWADGPDGMVIDSDSAVVAAAALSGIALSASSAGGGWTTTSVAINHAREYLSAISRSIVEDALGKLERRRVIERSSDRRQVRILVPLLAEWLRGAGGRGAIEALLSQSSLGRDISTVISSRDIYDMSVGWMYRGEAICDVKIKAWLEQFDDGWPRHTAFRLLQRFRNDGHYSAARMSDEVYPELAKAIMRTEAGALQKLTKGTQRLGARSYLENFFLVEPAVKGSSAGPAADKVMRALNIRKQKGIIGLNRVDIALGAGSADSRSVVLAVDDFAGSNQQAHKRKAALIHALTTVDPEWRDSLLVVLGVGIAADPEGFRSLEEPGVATAVGRSVSAELMATSPEAEIFEAGELERVCDLLEAFGEELQPDAPFGIGEDALLLVFDDNCPNNTLPIFWSNGVVQQKTWLPLVPRH